MRDLLQAVILSGFGAVIGGQVVVTRTGRLRKDILANLDLLGRLSADCPNRAELEAKNGELVGVLARRQQRRYGPFTQAGFSLGILAGLAGLAVAFAGFSALLAVSRSTSIDEVDGIRDALRLSGLAPAGVFLGKIAAVAAQLLVLETVLVAAVAVLYDPELGGFPLMITTMLAATVAVASTGVLYGAVVSGVRVRDTLLPVLLLPVLAPVLIGATKAFETAFGAEGLHGWGWCGLVSFFAVVYLVAGSLAYGALLEG